VVPLVDQDENAENVIIKHLPDVSIITTEEGVNENGQMVVKVVQNIPPTSPSSGKHSKKGGGKKKHHSHKKNHQTPPSVPTLDDDEEAPSPYPHEHPKYSTDESDGEG
jgi:hypothetical protein